MTKGSTKFFVMLCCLTPHETPMSHQTLHLVELWPRFNNLCKDPLLASSPDKIPSASNYCASNHSNRRYGMV